MSEEETLGAFLVMRKQRWFTKGLLFSDFICRVTFKGKSLKSFESYDWTNLNASTSIIAQVTVAVKTRDIDQEVIKNRK